MTICWPCRQLVDQDPAAFGEHLHPGGHVTLAVGLAVDDVRGLLPHLRQRGRRRRGAHPVGGDVDLVAVDQEVAVHHELTGLPTGTGQPGAVDHVVEPGLQDLQQVVTCLALQPVGLLVVTAELLLQHAVGEAGLLLLPQLQGVLRLLGAALAVHAGRVGAALERLVAADQVNTQPTRLLGHGTGIASHVSVKSLSSGWSRRGAAWAGGSRCAGRG